MLFASLRAGIIFQDDELFVIYNPAMRKDSNGGFWNLAASAVIGAAISAVTQVASNVISGEDWSSGVLVAAVTGAAGGALAATGLGTIQQGFANAAVGAIGEAFNQARTGGLSSVDGWKNVGKAAVAGFASGVIGGNGMRHETSSYYKVAQDAKSVAQKVFSKKYSNSSTPQKMLNRAIKTVKTVGYKASWKTGAKYTTGCLAGQVITRDWWRY